MNPNPYAPPAAPVADTFENTGLASKPSQIELATRMLWITLGLGVINSALEWNSLISTSPVAVVLSIQVLTFGILAWITVKIGRGRNWARILYLVTSLAGLKIILIQLPALFARSALVGSIGTVQVLLQLASLYLVFSEPGRRWFKHVSSETETPSN
jgi:hypothetical protein